MAYNDPSPDHLVRTHQERLRNRESEYSLAELHLGLLGNL